MDDSEFTRVSQAFWAESIGNIVGKKPPATVIWRELHGIQAALSPFMAESRNHAHLPSGGGMDILRADISTIEDGCLELQVGERSFYIVRPKTLTFEYISASPLNSFLLLDLAPLKPSDIYDPTPSRSESLLDLDAGNYVDRSVWEQGFLEHDDRGFEVPLPDSCRLVTRYFGGKLLIVSKRSLWNGAPETYDGRHNSMTSAQIRGHIERRLNKDPLLLD